jgi:hypothetical protein
MVLRHAGALPRSGCRSPTQIWMQELGPDQDAGALPGCVSTIPSAHGVLQEKGQDQWGESVSGEGEWKGVGDGLVT